MSIEPNQLADRYESFNDCRQLLAAVLDHSTTLNRKSSHPLARFYRELKSVTDQFGAAQAERNPFSMKEYRTAIGRPLPTIKTIGLNPHERSLLAALGLIKPRQQVAIPLGPSSGLALPLFPMTDTELEEATGVLHEFELPHESPTTLLHVSDTHLGFKNRLRPSGGGKAKYADHVYPSATFDRIISAAIELRVDAVIHTGDLFDHDVDEKSWDSAEKSLRRLDAAGIPFLFILGDHDRLAIGGSFAGAVDAMDRLRMLR